MANEEDECDSSSLFPVASQSDITSFLHAQAAKITGLNPNASDDDDDDESSIDGSLLASFTQVPLKTRRKSYLSHSCFASISSSLSQKANPSDDLTELNWLHTFKFKDDKNDLKEKTSESLNNPHEDQISKLSNELKLYNHETNNTDSLSFGVLIFLALYSKRNDEQLSWSLTIKQLYEYIQIHIKQITHKRGWKNLLKQTLTTIPCFVKTKDDLLKSRSIWTIDPYYRPLLTRAYLTRLPIESNKDVNRSSISVVNNFAPKATVKTKALPRLYERLCKAIPDNKDDDDEVDPIDIIKYPHKPISDRKRPRSMPSSRYLQSVKDNNQPCLASSSPWPSKLNKRHKMQNQRQLDIELRTSIQNTQSNIITPCPSIDHMYLNPKESSKNSRELSTDEDDDECDSSSISKSILTTQTQAVDRSIHRRKSSPPRKRLSLVLPSHRANTRISRKIIEQDLELLRQGNFDQQPLDLSNRSSYNSN